VTLAYQIHGQGPVDLVFVPGFLSHLEVLWEEPGVARLFDRQSEFARLILMDRRGGGLSDPLAAPMSLEEEVDDLGAVLDAAGSESAILLGYATGAPYCIQYAAKHPDRVRGLILYAGMARTTRSDDMPWALTQDEREERLDQIIEHWGEGMNASVLAPSAAGDAGLRRWFARLERLSASPGQVRLLSRLMGQVDVRHLLPQVSAPTLVLHRVGDAFFDPRHASYLAERIPGARLVQLPGVDNFPFVGDVESYLDAVEEFVTGARPARRHQRALLTVLFTDIADSTRKAAELGDSRWRDVLAAHDDALREELARSGGRVVKTIGDGFLAVFDGPPSRAVRCARVAMERVAALGIDLRAGLHTGECELIGDDVGGMAVHIAARVSALAGPHEILVSETLMQAVAGSGLRFEDRGRQELRGVPGSWGVAAGVG
jgi:class 3 adenylate cyclase/pimeloyl-ACP methyl ester carboxylesterase